MSHPPEEIVHEFKPLPDRSPEDQVKALTQIVHQMSQNCFEVRLELNDLREKNVELMKEITYLRSYAIPSALANFGTLTKN
jgi:hypothetical protein